MPEPESEDVTAAPARRPARTLLLALLVIAGVGAVGWLVAGQFGSDQGDHAHEAEATYAARAQPMSLGRPWVDPATKATESQILDVQFADGAHGFALTGGCAPGGGQCWYGLRSTSNGGRAWAYRKLPTPGLKQGEGFSASMFVFGAEAVSLEDNGRTWFSTDAGRTWRPVEAEAGLTYPTIPAGAVLRNVCGSGGCGVHAIDPRTGVSAPLQSQPTLQKIWWASPDGDTVGGWWIAGAVDDRTPALAITRDNGHSWKVHRLGSESGQVISVSVVTRSGQEAYVFVTLLPTKQGARPGTGRMYVSHDSGRTWQTVRPAADPNQRPGSVSGGVLLGPDRLLVGTLGAGTRISEDGGRTFADLPNVPEFAGFPRSYGRYVARSTGGFYTSQDGVGWSRLQFGE
ncbi:sialidase family protein [Flindersiella endophytica]